MEKDWKIVLLYDLYHNILTDKQADAVDLYYNQDLSLAEIAQELDITRQGAHDLIRRGVAHLKQQDEILGLLNRMQTQNAYLLEVKGLVGQIEQRMRRSEGSEDIFRKIYRILSRLTDEPWQSGES